MLTLPQQLSQAHRNVTAPTVVSVADGDAIQIYSALGSRKYYMTRAA